MLGELMLQQFSKKDHGDNHHDYCYEPNEHFAFYEDTLSAVSMTMALSFCVDDRDCSSS